MGTRHLRLFGSIGLEALHASAADEISRDRYENGLVDFSNVLDAQRTRLLLEEQLVVSEGRIFSSLIRLYKFLGGGWDPAGADSVP